MSTALYFDLRLRELSFVLDFTIARRREYNYRVVKETMLFFPSSSGQNQARHDFLYTINDRHLCLCLYDQFEIGEIFHRFQRKQYYISCASHFVGSQIDFQKKLDVRAVVINIYFSVESCNAFRAP